MTIDLENITKEYNGEKVLDHVNASIEWGKCYGFVGSHCGKSALLKIFMGIEKPDEGRIFLDGEDITDMTITDRARKGIGFAFQQPVRFKGIEVFDLIRLATGMKISAADACKYLSSVGLCARDYINREVNSSLSGGELKRIEIATILAKAPKLSVFDEPEAGIDLWSFKNLIEVFEGMRRKIKTGAIIIISHQERIMEIADDIIVIKDGKVDAQGPREEILPKLKGTVNAVKECRQSGMSKGEDEC